MSTPVYDLIMRSYRASVGAHVITSRFTYTVPAGRRAELVCGFVYVDTPALAIGTVFADVQDTSNGHSILSTDNSSAPGGLVRDRFSGVYLLEPGTVITGRTLNAGAASYLFSLMIQLRVWR